MFKDIQSEERNIFITSLLTMRYESVSLISATRVQHRIGKMNEKNGLMYYVCNKLQQGHRRKQS
jgi:type II secretory pathway component PulF